jgi:hypothetical protein
MMSFDPYTASEDEALAQPDSMDFPWSAFRQWKAVQVLNAQCLDFRNDPLTGLAICFRARISPPIWLSDAFLFRYDQTKSGSFQSWDDSFGAPHPKGSHIKKPKEGAHALMSWPPFRNGLLLRMFTGEEKLPKTRAGRKQAAERLGISESEVSKFLKLISPSRTYRFRKKIAGMPDLASVGTAHNPFGKKLQRP